MQVLFFGGFHMPHHLSDLNPFHHHHAAPDMHAHEAEMKRHEEEMRRQGIQERSPFTIHTVQPAHGIGFADGSAKEFNDKYQSTIGGADALKKDGCGQTHIGEYKAAGSATLHATNCGGTAFDHIKVEDKGNFTFAGAKLVILI